MLWKLLVTEKYPNLIRRTLNLTTLFDQLTARICFLTGEDHQVQINNN